MSSKVFVPITDEMLYEHPEWISTPLRPYQVGNPCFHWLATIEYRDRGPEPRIVRFDHTETPALLPGQGTDRQTGLSPA